MENDDLSVPVRRELLEKVREISRASGIPVEELIDKALALYLEKWEK